jgi:hypothetical protein
LFNINNTFFILIKNIRIMQKLANIKKDTTVTEIKNTNAVKGGCSCGDKRPPRNYDSNGNYTGNYTGNW